MTKLLNQRLLATGSGTFVGMLMAVWLAEPADDFSESLGFGDFGGELASGSLVVAGSILMAQRDRTKQNIGLGLGSAGISILARSLFGRFTKAKNGSGNGNGSDENGEGSSNGSGENNLSQLPDIFKGYEVI